MLICFQINPAIVTWLPYEMKSVRFVGSFCASPCIFHKELLFKLTPYFVSFKECYLNYIDMQSHLT